MPKMHIRQIALALALVTINANAQALPHDPADPFRTTADYVSGCSSPKLNADCRTMYAISRTVICKGDNQHWQPDYSSILGHLAAGGISNLYIPERDRHGASLTFENAGIALATTAAINVLQEFVLRGITSKRKASD